MRRARREAGAPRRPLATSVRLRLPNPVRAFAFATLAAAVAMTVIDVAIVNVALPTISADLAVTPARAIWVVNAYQLAVTIALLPLASLADIIGYRRVWILGPCAVHARLARLRDVGFAPPDRRRSRGCRALARRA